MFLNTAADGLNCFISDRSALQGSEQQQPQIAAGSCCTFSARNLAALLMLKTTEI